MLLYLRGKIFKYPTNNTGFSTDYNPKYNLQDAKCQKIKYIPFALPK